MEHRVVIYTPTGKDASLIALVFRRNDIASVECASPAQVAEALGAGAGALLIADEALSVEFWIIIDTFTKQQPTWSDLPVVVLTKKENDSIEVHKRYLQLGNVTLLERPVNSVTLVSAAVAALRARRRQYEMREIDRRKDEFLAMLAHELRNPLSPISAASDILKNPSLDRDVIRRTSDIISRQVQHMTALIDDLLDVSRVSRGLIDLACVVLDARQIVNNAVEQVRPLIEARQHRLTLQLSPEPALIQADHKRLVQIIANLLNNAAKYTPEGGEIILTMATDQSDVIFNVIDSGIGMEPEVLNHVFEMFSQAKRTSDRSQGGLGIGLALVKNLVILHKGSVNAYSDGLGCGSCFVVRLPKVLELPAVDQLARQQPLATQSHDVKLLIVDDNIDAAEMLAMFLQLEGYQTFIAHTGQSAIRYALLERPDACLLDIGLPDMDGSVLAKTLRESPETADSLLIAITGYGQEQDRQKTTSAGFHHHLVKPVNTTDLLSTLATLRR